MKTETPTISPVRHEHVPDWLRRRCLKVAGTQHGITTGSFVLEHAIRHISDDLIPGSWLDHWGSTRLRNGSVAFVSEPYGLSATDFRELARFADTLDLEVSISAASEWNPSGGTIRILLTPKGAKA